MPERAPEPDAQHLTPPCVVLPDAVTGTGYRGVTAASQRSRQGERETGTGEMQDVERLIEAEAECAALQAHLEALRMDLLARIARASQ